MGNLKSLTAKGICVGYREHDMLRTWEKGP
jgi:hypothetical protein